MQTPEMHKRYQRWRDLKHSWLGSSWFRLGGKRGGIGKAGFVYEHVYANMWFLVVKACRKGRRLVRL